MRNILVIAAHPDDEVLGCGGTIAKYAVMGWNVHVVIMAEGITSRDTKDQLTSQAALEDLHCAARKANELLGAASLDMEGFPDNRLDSLDLLDVNKVVESYIDRYRPQIVFTHSRSDLNVDHRVIHDAVVTACRPLPDSTIEKLLFFEIPSSTEWYTPASIHSFSPNWFEDISATLALKLKALGLYSSEMRLWPHPRSIKAAEILSLWRGATVGVDAAEAFILGRGVIR